MATSGWSPTQRRQLLLEMSNAEHLARSTDRLNRGYLLYRDALARIYRQENATEAAETDGAATASPNPSPARLLIFPRHSSSTRRRKAESTDGVS